MTIFQDFPQAARLIENHFQAGLKTVDFYKKKKKKTCRWMTFNMIGSVHSHLEENGMGECYFKCLSQSVPWYFGTSGRHFSRSPFCRLTGNDVSGH